MGHIALHAKQQCFDSLCSQACSASPDDCTTSREQSLDTGRWCWDAEKPTAQEHNTVC